MPPFRSCSATWDAANRELERLHKDGGLLREVVTAEEIAEIVARWTGIPVSKMLESDRERLLKLEERLEERVGRPAGSGTRRR
jgi:ATP-dependent Clp protease ATP-binding subunit ClpB